MQETGSPPGPARTRSRWLFLIRPRWLAWHVFVVVAVLAMLALGNWQLHRAESGNPLSWAYTFEWPAFAIFAIVFWVKTVIDEAKPPQVEHAGVPAGGAAVHTSAGPRLPETAVASEGGSGSGPQEDDDEELDLAAYNAYLADLDERARAARGRWRGWR